MKYITILLILFSLNSLKCEEGIEIFTLDLTNGMSQFTNYQENDPHSGEVALDGTTKVIQFSNLTHYAGAMTTDWITSASGNYWIIIEFKGELNKETGAFIGYERSDRLNVEIPLGLDYQHGNMGVHQIFRFKSNDTWNTYKAYIALNQGVKIRIILEQGNYFGINNHYDAKFKGLYVFDFTFSDVCPGDDEPQKLGYFEFLYSNNDLDNQIFFDDEFLEGSNSTHGKLRFDFPNSDVPCIKYAMYAFDSNNSVIEAFDPTYETNLDLDSSLDQIDAYTYIFTMPTIETLGCINENLECTINNAPGKCTKYTCPIKFHLYLDHGNNFSTKQAEYDWTKNNSLATFDSGFSVIVNKQEQTVLNTLVKTKEHDYICAGVCEINLDLTLNIKYKKDADGEFTSLGSTALTVTWSDYLYFQITSTPATYNLELFKIITTSDGNSFDLGKMFIRSYIEDQQSTPGKLEFKMKISGDAGLTKGKQFDLQFFTSTTLPERILEEEQTTTSLPKVQLTPSMKFYTEASDEPNNNDDDNTNTTDVNKKDGYNNNTNSEIFASKLLLSFFTLFALCWFLFE